MKMNLTRIALVLLSLSLLGCGDDKPSESAPVTAPKTKSPTDWSQWGGTHSKNMVSLEKNLPLVFDPGKRKNGSEEVDMATTENCLWVTKLGTAGGRFPTSNPITIGGGRILIGTNNESPRDDRRLGDRGILYCLDEKTGGFLWQLVVPKLEGGRVVDRELVGIRSCATISGNRAYVVTNRCEVLCLDMNGFADGNQGMQDEAFYMEDPQVEDEETGRPADGRPPLTNTDADIIWVYDMRTELGVFPHSIASSSPLVLEDRLYVTTSNGVDWSHMKIAMPEAPSLICIDKETGELLGAENAGISKSVLHCSWSSPSYGVVKGTPQVVFGAGDGWCYGFGLGMKQVEKDGEEHHFMEELWRYDANPPEYRNGKEGKPIKYGTPEGPSEIIGSPVLYKDHIYVMTGQESEHGPGVGMISCIDPSMRGDISGKAVWTFKGIERGMSTPSIEDDLVYIADYAGRVFWAQFGFRNAETGDLSGREA